MALFGMRIRSKPKGRIGGFHAEYLNDKVQLRSNKRMGLLRTTLSAASLMFGMTMIYVGLHYIPAFVNTSKVLKLSSNMTMSDYERESIFGPIVGPYIDNLKLQRTYIRAGQSIEVQYSLPKGGKADLEIFQCRRLWIVEILKCQVVGSDKVSVGRRASGKHRFTFTGEGFYHFRETVTDVKPNEQYRIVWKRS